MARRVQFARLRYSKVQHIAYRGGTLCNQKRIQKHRMKLWAFADEFDDHSRRVCLRCWGVIIRRTDNKVGIDLATSLYGGNVRDVRSLKLAS